MIQFIKSLFSTDSQKLRFTNNDEYTNIILDVTGTLPSWLTGSLVRNCVVPIHKHGEKESHLFDGVSMLHSFCIDDGRISYSSRFLRSQSYAKVIQSDLEFYHSKIDIDLKKAKHINDAAVSIFKYNDDFVALTESPLPVRFDVRDLKTLGNFDFHDDLPKKGTWESAHPHYCAESKEVFNFLVQYGHKTAYVLYKIPQNSSERKVIARIPVKKPAYMHSFATTKRYLILVEFPLVVNPLRLMFANVDSFASYIGLFKWRKKQGTRFLIVEKNSGKLVGQIKHEAFFSFHHANAYEDGDEIVIDLISHNYPNLKDLLPKAQRNEETMHGLQRFRLNIDTQAATHENVLKKTVEFPAISWHYNGQNYRYLYMVNFAKENTSLIKYDWHNRTERYWHAGDNKIIEPIFVPAAGASREDDGVLLTVISDENKGSSSLLVLNAENLEEIARADLPELLPNSFHGLFVPR